MNGLVVSNAFVAARVDAMDMLFRPDMMEGVRGVFASERARCRDGVFGRLYIGKGVFGACLPRPFLFNTERHVTVTRSARFLPSTPRRTFMAVLLDVGITCLR